MKKSIVKRTFILLLVGLMSFLSLGTFSCTSFEPATELAVQSSTDSRPPLKIVASVFAAYDFCRTITGAMADVTLLVPPGTEAHSFEPSPADIMLLNSADVFLCAGGDSDAWLDQIVSSLDNPHLLVLRMTDMVATETVSEPDNAAVSSEQEASSALLQGADQEIDEHVWTSLRKSQTIVATCADTFAQLDPAHASIFQANAQTFIGELKQLDNQITSIVQHAKRKTIVVGDRFPFRYFAEDYGLSWYAAFPGCSTAVDTSRATMMSLINTIRGQDIPVVFYIELSDQRIARTISEETGAVPLCLNSMHTVSRNDFEAGVTYLDLMRANAKNLEVALN